MWALVLAARVWALVAAWAAQAWAAELAQVWVLEWEAAQVWEAHPSIPPDLGINTIHQYNTIHKDSFSASFSRTSKGTQR